MVLFKKSVPAIHLSFIVFNKEYVSNFETLPAVAFLIGGVFCLIVGKSAFNFKKVCVKFSELNVCCCSKKLFKFC